MNTFYWEKGGSDDDDKDDVDEGVDDNDKLHLVIMTIIITCS
jgi:hypothetical protein